jgi:fused signal recognition particle receptor
VILVVGVNGTGKTTTIGKLAARLGAWRSVVVAAADTYRLRREQLEIWRSGGRTSSARAGADPPRRLRRGGPPARGRDVVVVDTAGRLHTQTNLMEELAKVRRVRRAWRGTARDAARRGCDHRQNGVQQARLFGDAVGVTGVVLTSSTAPRRRRRDPDRLRARAAGQARRRRRALEDPPFDPRDYARALIAG